MNNVTQRPGVGVGIFVAQLHKTKCIGVLQVGGGGQKNLKICVTSFMNAPRVPQDAINC